jgi:adenylate kinase
MRNLILLAVQGAGKGTLAKKLKEKYGYVHISTGDILRERAAIDDELGKQIKSMIDNGQFVPNDIIFEAVEYKITQPECANGYILDGFPRNLEQAEALDKIANVDLVIHLVLPKEEAVNRLLNRLTCSDCGFITRKDAVSSNVCPVCNGKLVTRSDDTLESIEKRFTIFETVTYPLLEKYKKQGVRVETIESTDKDVALNAVLKVLNEYNY